MEGDNLEQHKDHGFKVPKDYFESFDDSLLSKLSEKDMTLPDASGFKVPESYFDTLDDTIMNKVQDETKIIRFRPNPKLYYVAGIAASLVLMVAIFTNRDDNLGISTEMVESYFEDSDLDSYELADLLYEADLLEEDFVISETDFNEDNLETYLLENSDIEQLLQ
ncbi:MAG: hypothetical protein HRU26_02570 [Psychroserpens sp.]|nr:hypothetical protein [Psychroserpens sp.]